MKLKTIKYLLPKYIGRDSGGLVMDGTSRCPSEPEAYLFYLPTISQPRCHVGRGGEVPTTTTTTTTTDKLGNQSHAANNTRDVSGMQKNGVSKYLDIFPNQHFLLSTWVRCAAQQQEKSQSLPLASDVSRFISGRANRHATAIPCMSPAQPPSAPAMQ